MKIVVKEYSKIRNWEEALAFCFQKIIRLNFEDLIRGTMSGEVAFELGLLTSNLGRKNFGKIELIIGLNTGLKRNQLELHYQFGKFLVRIKQYNYGELCFQKCLEMIEKADNFDLELFKEIMCQKNNISVLSSSLKNDKSTVPPIKNLECCNMFESYEMFTVKSNILQQIFKSFSSKNLEHHQFGLQMVGHWEKFNKVTSIVLSCIVSEGFMDAQKALNNMVEFILDIPPYILMKKIVGFKVIQKILQISINQFSDPGFNFVDVQNLIEKAEIFNRDKNYFKYLSTYCKVSMLSCIQKYFNVSNQPKVQILYEIEKMMNLLSELYLMLVFNPKTTTLDKKHADKNIKILSLYEEEVKALELLVVKISSVMCFFYCQTIKNYGFESIICGQNTDYVKKHHIQNCQRIIAKSMSLSIQLSGFDVNIAGNIFNVTRIYMEEVLLFQNLIEVKNSKGNNIGVSTNCSSLLNKYHVVRKISVCRLLGLYYSLLSKNKIDDPTNVGIIDHLMYCIVLQGGYHVSVIWFLKAIKDFMILKSGVSMISYEDGEDPLYAAVFSKTLDSFKITLDNIIQKICDSQLGLELAAFKNNVYSVETEQRPIPKFLNDEVLNFRLLSKNGQTLLLPQVIFKNYKSLIILSEFLNFEKNGEYFKANLVEQNSYDSNSQLKETNLKFEPLKGILNDYKNTLKEALKESATIIEMFFRKCEGEYCIPLMRNEDVRRLLIPFYRTEKKSNDEGHLSEETINYRNCEKRENMNPTDSACDNVWSSISVDEECWVKARAAIQEIYMLNKERSSVRDQDDTDSIQSWDGSDIATSNTTISPEDAAQLSKDMQKRGRRSSLRGVQGERPWFNMTEPQTQAAQADIKNTPELTLSVPWAARERFGEQPSGQPGGQPRAVSVFAFVER